jgi:hypothetical protein
MIVKFEKLQGLWYAILPEYIEQGGEFSDCLMVENAPEMLDILSAGTDVIQVLVSDKLITNADIVLEKDRDEDEWGYYDPMENDHGFYAQVGLCPVNKWVWNGIHPDIIYMKVHK